MNPTLDAWQIILLAILTALGTCTLLAGILWIFQPNAEADELPHLEPSDLRDDDIPSPHGRGQGEGPGSDPSSFPSLPSVQIRCRECGERFDPADLDQVIYHEVHKPMPDAQYAGSKRIS